MLRAFSGALIASFAATIVGSASAIESTIYPGVGIGKVRLGMSASQVKKILGADYLVNDQETVSGTRYVEYGWDFSWWTVKFERRGSALLAVQVATLAPRQRTAKGIGPGTLWRKLVHTYPQGQCGWGERPSGRGLNLEYLVSTKHGTQTLYVMTPVFAPKPIVGPINAKVTNNRVLEVRVRTRFAPLKEFGAQRSYRCSEGWRNTATPKIELVR